MGSGGFVNVQFEFGQRALGPNDGGLIGVMCNERSGSLTDRIESCPRFVLATESPTIQMPPYSPQPIHSDRHKLT